ncbi:MAG: hypothetical protein HWD92_02525 [Flavobacteriia bacterium]|nr:hypothetical protein [Flavobacteriia bacterium]
MRAFFRVKQPVYLMLVVLTTLVTACATTSNRSVKAIYGFQNDTVVSIQEYDEDGRIIFDRTTQIISRGENSSLMTSMKASEYRDEKLLYEYYAHSNTGLRITLFDSNSNGSIANRYSMSVNAPLELSRNLLREIHGIENADSLIIYVERLMPESLRFSKVNRAQRANTEYFSTYQDSLGLLVKEYWTIEDTSRTEHIIKKFDLEDNLVYQYTYTEWQESVDEYRYDSAGNLVEELEIWDAREGRFQRREHLYNDGLLQRTNLYHGTALAFTYEYFYDDLLLVREVHTRVTDSEHFKDRKRVVTIEYVYEFY